MKLLWTLIVYLLKCASCTQISAPEDWRFRFAWTVTLHALKHWIDTIYILFSFPFFPFVGPLSRSPCELLPVGTGHPVQAVLKSLTVMSGCASRGTASLPQEVHVINLRGYVPENPDNTPAKVGHSYWNSLKISQIEAEKIHKRPVEYKFLNINSLFLPRGVVLYRLRCTILNCWL